MQGKTQALPAWLGPARYDRAPMRLPPPLTFWLDESCPDHDQILPCSLNIHTALPLSLFFKRSPSDIARIIPLRHRGTKKKGQPASQYTKFVLLCVTTVPLLLPPRIFVRPTSILGEMRPYDRSKAIFLVAKSSFAPIWDCNLQRRLWNWSAL